MSQSVKGVENSRHFDPKNMLVTLVSSNRDTHTKNYDVFQYHVEAGVTETTLLYTTI